MNKTLIQNQTQLKNHDYKIIEYLIKFKYLNRVQIQKFLNQKNHHRVLIWLDNLTKNKIINKFYENSLVKNPAIYCLDIKSKDILISKYRFTKQQVRRVYQDKRNSLEYKNHLVLIAYVYLSLVDFCKSIKAKLSFNTYAELMNMKYLIYPAPDCYFAITGNDGIIKRYFLDYFNPANDLKWPHKRIVEHLDYFDNNIWQSHSDKNFPEIILILQNKKDLKSINNFIEKQLNKRTDELNFYLTTKEIVEKQGLNNMALTKVNVKE